MTRKLGASARFGGRGHSACLRLSHERESGRRGDQLLEKLRKPCASMKEGKQKGLCCQGSRSAAFPAPMSRSKACLQNCSIATLNRRVHPYNERSSTTVSFSVSSMPAIRWQTFFGASVTVCMFGSCTEYTVKATHKFFAKQFATQVTRTNPTKCI